MKNNLLALLLLVTCHWGCKSLVQEVSPSLLGTPTAHLVVHGYLCPQDTLLSVHLGLTAPPALFGQQARNFSDTSLFPLLRRYRVVLRQANRELALPFADRYGCFVAPAAGLPIVAGQQYQLVVWFQQQQVASAICSIPALPPDFTVQRDSVLEHGQRWQQNGLQYGEYYFSRIRLRWNDPPGPGHYYAYTARYFYTGMAYFWNPATSPPTRDSSQVSSYGLVDFNDDASAAQLPTGFKSDEGADGQLLSGRRATVRPMPPGTYKTIQVQSRGEVSLMAIEKSLYDFNLRLLQRGGDFENPFAEPQPAYSNISGGVGIFAGYNRRTRQVRIY